LFTPIQIKVASTYLLIYSRLENTSAIHQFPVAMATNFTYCILKVRQLRNITHNNGLPNFTVTGATDNNGQLVGFAIATGTKYGLCLQQCGAAPEAFNWSQFSQQFGSWLLPWLALISQLPFGANDKFDNFLSVLLTVGSPTLAAYSLALTTLNGRWIARRFSAFRYPNIRYAVQILSSLQQSPVTVTTGPLLSSLIVLPENDEWWRELVIWLNYTHTWSLSAVTQIAWVIIAYVFTLIDSFTGDATVSINSNGQGVGSAWLWLLPIVIGWLQISPKCDSVRVRHALERANRIAYVATQSGMPVLASSESMQHAISLTPSTDDPLRCDEQCTAPIFNYARFLPWVQAVEDVCDAFHAASDRASRHSSVDPQVKWEASPRHSHSKLNRTGTLDQVNSYCLSAGEPGPKALRAHRPTQGIWSRLFMASVIALSLQWGTTGAAVVVTWFTPTIGNLKLPCGHWTVYLSNVTRTRLSVRWISVIRRVVHGQLDNPCVIQCHMLLLNDNAS
jgi:hypothetical protein